MFFSVLMKNYLHRLTIQVSSIMKIPQRRIYVRNVSDLSFKIATQRDVLWNNTKVTKSEADFGLNSDNSVDNIGKREIGLSQTRDYQRIRRRNTRNERFPFLQTADLACQPQPSSLGSNRFRRTSVNKAGISSYILNK